MSRNVAVGHEMDDLPTHIGNKERSAGRQGLMSKRTPLAVVYEPEDFNDPSLRDGHTDRDEDANSNAAPNNVRRPGLCRRRQTDAGCGKSPLDEMEQGLEQNERDDKIER